MTRSDLIALVAARYPFLKMDEAENLVLTIFDEIAGSLESGRRVELRGFGSFAARERRARTGRNPRTGEKVEVSAKRAPFFKAGKPLRDRLNARGTQG